MSAWISHYTAVSLSHYTTVSLSHYTTVSLSHYSIVSLSQYIEALCLILDLLAWDGENIS